MSSSGVRNDKPIIGILVLEKTCDGITTVYMAASYVKFLELAGARVIPVMPNQSEEEYKKLFNSINGILFPGGPCKIATSSYARTAQIFYDLAIEANQKGDYFPIWGTCLGLQHLCYLTSQENLRIITNTNGVSLPLTFTDEVKESRMFKDCPADFMEVLATEPLAAHAHKYSVSAELYNKNEKLQKFYRVLSTDHDGTSEIISTWEAYDYPIYSTQWHPEKNAFEWMRAFIDHSPNGIKLTFYFANFFVGEARKNFHSFECEAEATELLVFNHRSVYTGHKSGYTQLYYF